MFTKKILIIGLLTLVLALIAGTALAAKPPVAPLTIAKTSTDGMVVKWDGVTNLDGYTVRFWVTNTNCLEPVQIVDFPTLGKKGRAILHYGAGTDYRNHYYLNVDVSPEAWCDYQANGYLLKIAIFDASGIEM